MGSQPQSTSTTATEERSQPWQAMQEVQNLFKPEMPAASDAKAGSGPDATEEEPLKLNLFRTALNSASTNIANVEH